MTMTERKVIKAKVGLLELAKQLGSVKTAAEDTLEWVMYKSMRRHFTARTKADRNVYERACEKYWHSRP